MQSGQAQGRHHVVEGLNASSRSQIHASLMEQSRLQTLSEQRMIRHEQETMSLQKQNHQMQIEKTLELRLQANDGSPSSNSNQAGRSP